MSIGSIISIVLWAFIFFDGIYGLAKGYFCFEKKKAKKHDSNAYCKWTRLSGVFFLFCGLINAGLTILDDFSNVSNNKYDYFVFGVAMVTIAAVAVTYVRIVKPADKALGSKNESDKISKDTE